MLVRGILSVRVSVSCVGYLGGLRMPPLLLQCTYLSLENSLHSSKLQNTLRAFFEISKHFLRNFANLLELSFEFSLELLHTISTFRKCQDNSAFENSSKVWRYFVSFQKSLVFVEKWRNVSKFVEIRSHYFCTVLYGLNFGADIYSEYILFIWYVSV